MVGLNRRPSFPPSCISGWNDASGVDAVPLFIIARRISTTAGIAIVSHLEEVTRTVLHNRGDIFKDACRAPGGSADIWCAPIVPREAQRLLPDEHLRNAVAQKRVQY